MWFSRSSKASCGVARLCAPPLVLSVGALYLLLGQGTVHRVLRHLFASGARGVSSVSASWELRSFARQADLDRIHYESALARRSELAGRIEALASERAKTSHKLSRVESLLDSVLAGDLSNAVATDPRTAQLERHAEVLLQRSQSLRVEATECDSLIAELSNGLRTLDERIGAMRHVLAARERKLNRAENVVIGRSALGDTLRLLDEMEAGHRDGESLGNHADLEF